MINGPLAVVIIGILTFVLGVLVTLLCRYLRDWIEASGREDPE